VTAFCESLLTQGDMLAVTADYFPLLLLWLVTTPWQARLMREALSRQAEVKATATCSPTLLQSRGENRARCPVTSALLELRG
jgi:hypothetical protein